MEKKYFVCPGMVTSKTDGQRHYINATMLMHLYGVDPEECEIYDPKPWWPRSLHLMAAERGKGLRILCPRFDGNYCIEER